MERNGFRLVLENETAGSEVGDKGKTFYRYGLGDFQIWFSQDDRNGNIYAAYMHEREDVQNGLEDKFEFYIGTLEEMRGAYYPNSFEIRPKSYPMGIDEAREFAKDMERACNVMEAVQDFFNSGKHFVLYANTHDVPRVKVLGLGYKGCVEDEELYRGSDKQRALAAFLHSHPKHLFSPVSTELLGVAYDRQEATKKVDELISREAIMSEIVTYNVRHGRSYETMDDDWKKAWDIIADFGEEDCDLVRREDLLNAVLSEFGCDLAYYDGDLRFVQEAIEQIPAVSAGKVDDLIFEAAERSEKDNLRETVECDVTFGKE